MEARQRGAINTRDDKQRQFFYRAAVADSVSNIGEWGRQSTVFAIVTLVVVVIMVVVGVEAVLLQSSGG